MKQQRYFFKKNPAGKVVPIPSIETAIRLDRPSGEGACQQVDHED